MAKRQRDLRMSVDEFLVWDDGTDTRYELEDGVPVAMAPAVSAHGRIAQNVGAEIDRLVEGRPPCRAIQAGGVLVSRSDGRFYIPDVLMTCEELASTPHVYEPRLIVEILSPTTKGIDQKRKVPAYGRLPSVEEIWLIASDERWAVIWKRSAGGWVAELPYEGDAVFHSPALGGEVALDRLYDLTGL
jgi:Uma2 family endonuclease